MSCKDMGNGGAALLLKKMASVYNNLFLPLFLDILGVETYGDGRQKASHNPTDPPLRCCS